MLSYLRCIKSHRGSNDPECRNLSKSYLSCRMDRYVCTLSFIAHTPLLAKQTHIPWSCDRDKGEMECCDTKLSKSPLDQVVGIFVLGFEDCKGEIMQPSFRPSCQI
jgi:hypothetical protein